MPARKVDPSVDMAAYDRLPAGVRALVAEMPMDVVAEGLEESVAWFGAGPVEAALLEARERDLAECRRLSEEACAR